MKIASWNVNGIRACSRKTFFSWLEHEKADIVCLQEIKAHPEQLDSNLHSPPNYHVFWDPALKRGYSGVAVFSRLKPVEVRKGLGIKNFDQEGRTLILEFPQFVLINSYFPNGQRDHLRVPFKLEYGQAISTLCKELMDQRKEIIICGDFNTAHRKIDLKNPKGNTHTTGFLPIERQWLDSFIELGFIDIFRRQNPQGEQYTWWSFRPTVRERNIGWRIDYFFISPGLLDKVKSSHHQPQVMGSDHCPIGLQFDFS